MKKAPPSKKDEVLKALLQMKNWELAELFEEFAEASIPFPGYENLERSRYFLGISTSPREDGPRGKRSWGPWTHYAVAYPNKESYPGGVQKLFLKQGICRICQIPLTSRVDHIICPVCGADNYTHD